MAHVLIVYSNPDMTEVPAVVCDEAGHSVEFAAEPDAPGRLSVHDVDLVLLVGDAPLATMRAIRAVAPAIDMVVLSDPIDAEEQSALRQAGVRAIVFRPYSVPTLRKALSNELAGGRRHKPQTAFGS